jgi:nitrous oxide reductase
MSKQGTTERISRRAFLRGSAVGAGAAGVAATALGAAAPAHAKTHDTAGRQEAGYRETEHVRRVYALSRF